jgi:superfamily I DNA/RNA helicase
MSLKLSTYQEDIIDAFKYSSENLYIRALAGCGKTFMLLELAKLIEDYSVFLAFNKSIQLEIQGKIDNPKMKTYTFNGLGYLIMLKNCENKKIEIKNFKTFSIVHQVLSKYFDSRVVKPEVLVKTKENVIALYELCKTRFCDLKNEEEIQDVISLYELFSDVSIPSNLLNILAEVDIENFKQFEKSGIINFSDQLYITLKKIMSKEWQVPGYLLFQNILTDEAQDLSKVQQLLLFFIGRKNARRIFVLDEWQSIYGFSGSDTRSFQTIKSMFKPKELELPINYRCPSLHLEYINKLYDIGIQARQDAPEGNIYNINVSELIQKAQIGDYIIARKNKDLCEIILSLIKVGKPIYLKDVELVKKIIKIIEGAKTTSVAGLSRHLEKTRLKHENELKKQYAEMHKTGIVNEEKINNNTVSNANMDIFECVEILLENYKKENKGLNIDNFVNYINRMLNTTNSKDSILCSSVHQVKGLEANNVFVLGEARVYYELARTSDQIQQEKNLSYISLSRARENLYLVKIKDKKKNNDDDFDEEDYFDTSGSTSTKIQKGENSPNREYLIKSLDKNDSDDWDDIIPNNPICCKDDM